MHCPCLLGAPSVCRRQLGARRPLALPRFPGSSWGPAALPLRTDGRGWRPQTSHPRLPRGSPCGGRASLLRPQRLTPDLPLGICPAAARPEAPCGATFQQCLLAVTQRVEHWARTSPQHPLWGPEPAPSGRASRAPATALHPWSRWVPPPRAQLREQLSLSQVHTHVPYLTGDTQAKANSFGRCYAAVLFRALSQGLG